MDWAPVEGSFRDPSGFVYTRDGTLYRQVNASFQREFEACTRSGLYEELAADGLLVSHRIADPALAATPGACAVLEPARIGFVSYPYEWSFGQLRDAALLTLEIQERALAKGFVLRDASAYNVQFHDGRPIHIDTLSFEPYREGSPWAAYRQFCEHFLVPLTLMSRRDVRCGGLLRTYVDGIPLDLGSALLPLRSWVSPATLLHVHLHALAQRRYADGPAAGARPARPLAKPALLQLVRSLRGAVGRLDWRPAGTTWAEYETDNSYSPAAARSKHEAVANYLRRVPAATVWDLGANTGEYSRVARGLGSRVVAFDMDPAAVERNWRRVREGRETGILPLLVDLTNPSPALGWAHRERLSLEERGPADAVLALALVHHLAIGHNLPLDRIAAFLARVGRTLVIEFVPKSDSQVQRLLRSRPDVFPDYTREGFERAFGRHFAICDSCPIEESERRLYPLLFATLEPLRLAVKNPGGFALGDLGLALVVTLAGAGMVYGVLAALAKLAPRRWPPPLTALVTFAVVAWFWGYNFAARRVGHGPLGVVILLAAAIVTVSVVAWLGRHPRLLDGLGRFLTTFGGILVAGALVTVAYQEVRGRRMVARSGLVAELARPVRPAATASPVRAAPPYAAGRRPNIYLIIPDQHAGTSVLREQLGFDNRPFEDSLRALGFTVPRLVLANHTFTMLSLPSILNFTPLGRLRQEVGPSTNDPRVPDHLLQTNRAMRFLKGEGYRVLFFPSQWWPSTRHLALADWEWDPWPGWNLNLEFTRSDFRRAVRLRSPIGSDRTRRAADADYIRGTFKAIAATADSAGPLFIFAHIISPHAPYVLDRDCRTVPVAPTNQTETWGYLTQMQCVDRLLLRLVRHLLARSSVAPIILLQSDHGSDFRFARYAKDPDAGPASASQARERFVTFGAYHLPGGAVVPDTMTAANLFRVVLNRYFGTDLPLLPADLYLSHGRAFFAFRHMTPEDLVEP